MVRDNRERASFLSQMLCPELEGYGLAAPPCQAPLPGLGLSGSSASQPQSWCSEGRNVSGTKPSGALPHTIITMPAKALPCSLSGKQEPSPLSGASPIPQISLMSAWPCSTSPPSQHSWPFCWAVPLRAGPQPPPTALADCVHALSLCPALSAALRCIPFAGMTLLALRAVLSRVGSGRVRRAVCGGECRTLSCGPEGRGRVRAGSLRSQCVRARPRYFGNAKLS